MRIPKGIKGVGGRGVKKEKTKRRKKRERITLGGQIPHTPLEHQVALYYTISKPSGYSPNKKHVRLSVFSNCPSPFSIRPTTLIAPKQPYVQAVPLETSYPLAPCITNTSPHRHPNSYTSLPCIAFLLVTTSPSYTTITCNFHFSFSELLIASL